MANRNSSSKHNFLIGQRSENDAQRFLEKHGLILLEKNFIAYNSAGKKTGEIDLIMQDNHYLVFTEVKARSNSDYGDVFEMISRQKQSCVIRAAKHYLIQKDLYNSALCRFDVIGITWNKINAETDEIVWIKNAFEVQY